MKIFSATQIRAADAYTIQHEPVSSLQLMERAARACTDWLLRHFSPVHPFYIFCGTGNNGGDGLAIARQLQVAGYTVHTCLLGYSTSHTPDYTANLEELRRHYPGSIHEINAIADFPALPPAAVIIDAIFGTGLNRAIEGWMAGIVHKLNDHYTRHTIIAIDIPSGLLADSSSRHLPVVHAHHTLSFAFYKLAFMLPENSEKAGHVHILQIGLHPDYITQTPARFHLTDEEMIRTIYQPRQPFAHKGTYGHALLIAGSEGKIGAAVLSARACLRTGAGLLTSYVPRCGYTVMQIAEPCAMCITDVHEQYSTRFDEAVQQREGAIFHTIGIGPGLGTATATASAFGKLLEAYRLPMVIDADALNLLGRYPYLQQQVPPGSILTPHPKEFERMFGPSDNDFERLELLSGKARELQLYILVKGRYTAIGCPDGAVYFNSTGNPGMATAGSGDVLTGILTALLAQRYSPKAAVLLGTYLHGKAGDLAAAQLSQEAMTAADIITYLGAAFLLLPAN